MQAYISDEKDKGLFTFYLEQADLEDQLQIDRKANISERKEKKKQVTKQESPHQQQHVAQSVKQIAKNIEPIKKEEKKVEEVFQRRQNMMEILEKQKFKPMRTPNIKLIIGEQQQHKVKLQNILDTERKRNKEFKDFEKDHISNSKYNIFQKLYLPPKTFQTQLQEQYVKLQRVAQPLRTKAHQQISKEHKKQQHKKASAQYLQKGKSYQQINPRNLLPKLELHCISRSDNEMMPSSRLQSKILRPKKQMASMDELKKKSEREVSFCVESARYSSERLSKQKMEERKMYSVFLDNSPSHKQEEDKKNAKELMYLQILKQLRFK